MTFKDRPKVFFKTNRRRLKELKAITQIVLLHYRLSIRIYYVHKIVWCRCACVVSFPRSIQKKGWSNLERGNLTFFYFSSDIVSQTKGIAESSKKNARVASSIFPAFFAPEMTDTHYQVTYFDTFLSPTVKSIIFMKAKKYSFLYRIHQILCTDSKVRTRLY